MAGNAVANKKNCLQPHWQNGKVHKRNDQNDQQDDDGSDKLLSESGKEDEDECDNGLQRRWYRKMVCESIQKALTKCMKWSTIGTKLQTCWDIYELQWIGAPNKNVSCIALKDDTKFIRMNDASHDSRLLWTIWQKSEITKSSKLIVRLMFRTKLCTSNEWLCPNLFCDESVEDGLWIRAAIIPSSLQTQWIDDELCRKVSQPFLSHKLNWTQR